MSSWYSRLFYPRLMDFILRRHASLRAAALSQAYGDVLEVGFGTGLNLPHYPAAVSKLWALDVADSLPRLVEGRIRRSRFPVERVMVAPGSGFPLADSQFDCVVTTWTLCSVSDASQLLSEIRRVLRPGGAYLFLEHGRAQNPQVARRQTRWSKASQVLANGCRLDVPIDRVVERAGYTIVKLKRFEDGETLPLASHMYQGVATPGRSR